VAISAFPQPVSAAPARGVIAGRPAIKKKIENTFLIGIPHIGSVACLFWFYSHPIHIVEVVTFLLGYFIIGMGTGIGFHRYFSHKSYLTYPWVAYLLGAAGSMSFQSSLLTWVTDHRRHHAQTDHCGDAHSPIVDGHCDHPDTLKGLFYSHIGWMFDDTVTDLNIYGRDLARDPIIRFYTRTHYLWPVLSLAIPALIGYAFGGRADAWGCVFAACLRTTLFQHSVWAVNSFGHTFGYQNYDLGNKSMNNVFLAAVTFGDGYHNNHHRYPRSAFHGLRKWEIDFNGILITLLGKLGLARKIIVADRYLDEAGPTE
jgi:stearoyl-CoA desaturase (delta-9 desaturase)